MDQVGSEQVRAVPVYDDSLLRCYASAVLGRAMPCDPKEISAGHFSRGDRYREVSPVLYVRVAGRQAIGSHTDPARRGIRDGDYSSHVETTSR